jgi:PAS domain S-box-containing protein
MKSLLVEDNAADARLIREMLKESSVECFQLHHEVRLSSALERLRKEQFDVVLLDLGLPDAQGMQTLAMTQTASATIPIVVLTGRDDRHFALEAVGAGAQDYLVKGRFDGELLVRTIRYAVQRKRAEEEIRKLNAELEQRVVERTAQLHRANQQLLKEIAERKQAEEALRASEERWAITLQSIGDAVMSTDTAGKIVFMNDVAQKLTGWPLAEAKEKDLDTVFHIVQETTRTRQESPVAKVIRQGQVVGLADSTLLIRRDGAELLIEDSGAPIRNREGRIQGVVLVFHDVSERRKMEKVLRDSERLATTGRLAATIAHEIHNPLDLVGNLLYLIQTGTKEEDTRQYIAAASEELERLAKMTQQMLTFQRDSAKPVTVHLGEVLDSVLALYHRKIESSSIKIDKDIQLPDSIVAQPGELRQVFANLVGNAIEAVRREDGRIRLRVHASRDWRDERRGLRVLIADNGSGITAALQKQIFEPFLTTKGESGTGLGLWIATGIVGKYRGTVRVRSSTREGRSGSCFSVFFPSEM